jgi:translation initiation factor eIF-2B subunit delta
MQRMQRIDLIKDLEKQYLFHDIKSPIIRCDMLLHTIIFLLKDEATIDSIKTDKNKWLKTLVKPIIKYLAASSKNALKYIDKFFIGNKSITPTVINEIIEQINQFIYKRIILAHNKIIDFAIKRLDNTFSGKAINNILIFGNNPLINKIICSLENKNIYIVDDTLEKKSSLSSYKLIIDHNINLNTKNNLYYLNINSLSYVLSSNIEVVLLGCNEVMSNGDIIGPTGTALVSLVSNNSNIPVLVCCETLSFTKKVQTGVNFETVLSNKYKEDKRDKKCYNIAVVSYDITPSKYINQIITEKGIIHPLAVYNFL